MNENRRSYYRPPAPPEGTYEVTTPIAAKVESREPFAIQIVLGSTPSPGWHKISFDLYVSDSREWAVEQLEHLEQDGEPINEKTPPESAG